MHGSKCSERVRLRAATPGATPAEACARSRPSLQSVLFGTQVPSASTVSSVVGFTIDGGPVKDTNPTAVDGGSAVGCAYTVIGTNDLAIDFDKKPLTKAQFTNDANSTCVDSPDLFSCTSIAGLGDAAVVQNGGSGGSYVSVLTGSTAINVSGSSGPLTIDKLEALAGQVIIRLRFH